MIRFTIADVHFEVDTAEEALIIVRGVKHRRETSRGEPLGVEWFLKKVNHNGQKILAALATKPNGITTEELAAAAGLRPATMPPIFRHISSVAKAAGFNMDSLIARRVVYVGGYPKSIYSLSSELSEKLAAA